MKKVIAILCALVLIGVGKTEASIGTPDVTTLSWLNVPVTCLDTVAGVQRIPDSAHVVVFFGNSPNAPAYAARDATAGAGATWIDSVRYAGRTLYYFWDQIADIDADSGAGFYSGVVSLFTQGYSTDNYFSFNLVDTTAQEYGSLNYFNIEDIKSSVEPTLNRLNIYVDTGGSDDSSGLTWNTAVASLRIAESKCTGADEYYIYVAPGTYASQSCTVDVSNVKIIGSGYGMTTLEGVTAKSIIKVDHTGNGFEIEGFTFTAPDTNTDTRGLELRRLTGFLVKDCHFRGGRTAIMGGTAATAATKGRIQNCYIYRSGWDGITIGGSEIWIKDNVIDSLVSYRADGILLSGAHQVVTGNFIYSTECSTGIRVPGTAPMMIANNFVQMRDGVDYMFEGDKSVLAFVGNHGMSNIDTMNTLEEDIYTVYAEADSILDGVKDLKKFLGANDGYYQKLYPLGSANKDSAEVCDSGDNLLGTLYYFHTGSIIDSVRWEKW